MYIKKVTINGLKSFQNETVIGPFHPEVNIVVGRNGSGKTNLFTAIQFVFSDEYATLDRRQLDSLVCKKRGPGKAFASVEIVFDNSDKTLNIYCTEVIIKRIVKAGTSQFFFNGKSISRKKLVETLNSSAVSFFSDYFIVKQGNVSQVARATDKERLEMVLKVTGGKQYEERRKEIECTRADITSMNNKKQEMIKQLIKRRVLLEKEHLDNKEFRKLDGKRRLIEYAIAEKKLDANKNQLAKLKENRDQLYKEQAARTAKCINIEQKLNNINLALQEKKEELHVTVNEENELKCDLNTLEIEEGKIRAKIADLQEEMKENKIERKSIEKKLNSLNKEIELKLTLIEQTNLNLAPIEENIKELKEKVTQEAEELKYLYSKKQRVEQFSNKKARDRSLHNDIKKMEKFLQAEEHRLQKAQVDDRGIVHERLELEDKIRDTKEKIERLKVAEKDRIKNLKILEGKLEQVVNRKKKIFEEEHKLGEEKRLLEMNYSGECRRLESIIQESILLGKENIDKVLESLKQQPNKAANPSQYHGCVIDCFNYSEDIEPALEAVAGNKLFCYVFDTHGASKTVMDELKDKKLLSGADFVALNCVRANGQKLSSLTDAALLLGHIEYDPVYDKLMKSLFGNVLVCKSFEAASEISAHKNSVCVTLVGDVAYPSGMQVGGYSDENESSIKIYRSLSKMSEKKKSIEEGLENCRKELNICNNIINNCCHEKAELVTLGLKHEYENSQLKTGLYADESMLERIKSCAGNVEEYSSEVTEDLNNWSKRLEKLKDELNTNFTGSLTAEDKRRIEELKHSKTEKLLKEEELKKSEMERPKSIAEFMLTEKLYKTRDQLQQELQELDVEKQMIELVALKKELSKIENEKLEEKFKACKEQRDKVEALKNESNAINDEKETLERKKKKLDKGIDWNTNEITFVIDMYKKGEEEREAIKIEIDQIACLPNLENYPDLPDFSTLSIKELQARLLKVNQEQRKYPKININVQCEFILLNKPLAMIEQQMEKLTNQIIAANDMMKRIEQIATNAVHQMFQTINQNFKETFQQLVPQGDVELVVITATRTYSVAEAASVDINEFIGIGIDVFLAQGHQVRRVNQLSGGQKTLVALALIFGVRKCCPAPFYLFDEMDQALDSTRRQIVGEMMQEMSSDVQIIVTTFRPELLEFGDQFFQVQGQNSMSRVVDITKEDALHFIESI